VLLDAVIGAFVSMVYGAFSYAVAKSKNNETFDPVKFGKFLAIGFILGGASASLGVDMQTIEGMSTVGFFSVIIDKLAGMLFHKRTTGA